MSKKLCVKVIQSLASVYGCKEDVDAISRCVYKHTDCGARFYILNGVPTLGTMVEGSEAELSCAYEGDGSVESVEQWHDETIEILEAFAEENFHQCF
jgi:hypothetical protein